MSKAKRTIGTKAPKTGDKSAATGELEALRLPELQARYRDVVGETTKSPNRKFLIGKIAEALATRPESQVLEDSPDESAKATPSAEPPEEQDSTRATLPAPAAHEIEEALTTVAESKEPHACVAESAGAAPAAEIEGQAGTPATDAPPQAPMSGTASAAEQPEEKKVRGRFAALSINDLQALYLEKVGRATGSEHRGYLIWKIREAEKGRITVGPVPARTMDETRDMKVLPLSLETTTVEKMDAAWRAKGIKSRAEFLRKAIGSYLTQLGATEEATLFTGE